MAPPAVVVASSAAVKNHSQSLGVLMPEDKTLLSVIMKPERSCRESPESVSAHSFIQFFL